jgi:hypothetical protein
LLRRFLIDCILHATSHTLEAHRLFTLFVGCGLNLAGCALAKVLLLITLISIFILLFILFVCSWRQLHLVSELLIRACLLREYCQFTIVFDDLIGEEHLLDHFVVGPWMLEEWIVHLATSTWIDSDHVAFSAVFENRFANVFLVLQIGSLFHRFEEG